MVCSVHAAAVTSCFNGMVMRSWNIFTLPTAIPLHIANPADNPSPTTQRLVQTTFVLDPITVVWNKQPRRRLAGWAVTLAHSHLEVCSHVSIHI